MTEFELFEFDGYLSDFDFKKVDNIFLAQCIYKFNGFNTSINANHKDYLSYLVAYALHTGMISQDKEGYTQFLQIANGFSERFFNTTIYHIYNLCEPEKKTIFFDLLNVAKETLSTNNIKDYKTIQLHSFLEKLCNNVNSSDSYYYLNEYHEYNKKINSYLLAEKLDKNLYTQEEDNKKYKI